MFECTSWRIGPLNGGRGHHQEHDQHQRLPADRQYIGALPVAQLTSSALGLPGLPPVSGLGRG